jgi:hypothetical protein
MVLDQYPTRHADFTVEWFHEHLMRDHRFTLSYSWVKDRLQAHGVVRKAAKRGAHRRKRERRSLPGIPLLQDDSPHA